MAIGNIFVGYVLKGKAIILQTNIQIENLEISRVQKSAG